MASNADPGVVTEVDVCVVGAGQSGLSLGYHLQRTARRSNQQGDIESPLSFVLLDERDRPGGAWTQGWDTLALFSPATYSSLAGWPMPSWTGDGNPSAEHVVDYLTAYENRYGLPVHRPVHVTSVTEQAGSRRLLVETDTGDSWAASVVVNATGTWSRPFWPTVAGVEAFRGRQMHTVDYRSAAAVPGDRVLVIGGGNSAAQIAADLLLHSNHQVTWCTREPPAFLPDEVDGPGPVRHRDTGSPRPVPWHRQRRVASLGDIVAVPPVREARDTKRLTATRTFSHLVPSGAVWDDGTTLAFDTIIWCTGFRPSLAHLRGLDLPRINGHPDTSVGPEGGAPVVAAGDPRIYFLGYGDWCGPASATLIGVNRPAREAAASIRTYLRSIDVAITSRR